MMIIAANGMIAFSLSFDWIDQSPTVRCLIALGCIALRFRMKKIEGCGFKSAARGNYYRAIIKLIQFIKDSPSVAFGTKGFKLADDRWRSLTRSVESWETITAKLSKRAKDEAIERNNLENYRDANQWGTVAEVFAAAMRVVGVLERTMKDREESPFTETEANQFVQMLYTVMNAFRGGRGGSIAGMYVCIFASEFVDCCRISFSFIPLNGALGVL